MTLSLFHFFPLSEVRCCLQLFHRLICYSSPPFSVSCLLLPVSFLSCLLHISLKQSSHLSLGLTLLYLSLICVQRMEELHANDPKFAGQFGKMLQIMKLGYRDALSAHGPFTVFAATDSGFGTGSVSIHLNIYAKSVGPFLIFMSS